MVTFNLGLISNYLLCDVSACRVTVCFLTREITSLYFCESNGVEHWTWTIWCLMRHIAMVFVSCACVKKANIKSSEFWESWLLTLYYDYIAPLYTSPLPVGGHGHCSDFYAVLWVEPRLTGLQLLTCSWKLTTALLKIQHCPSREDAQMISYLLQGLDVCHQVARFMPF